MTADNKKVIKIGAIVIGALFIVWLLMRNKGQLLRTISDNVPAFNISMPLEIVDYEIPGFEYQPRDYPLPVIGENKGSISKPCNFCSTSRAEIKTPSRAVETVAEYIPFYLPAPFGGASNERNNSGRMYWG